MCFIQTESVLQTKNRSGPAKNRFSVALVKSVQMLVCPLFHEFRPNLVDCIFGWVKDLNFDTS